MKKILFSIGLAMSCVTQLFAGETLHLKIEPEQDYLLSGSTKEVVVKIDLAAAKHKLKHKRTPLNLAVVLDRSGSMGGAKIEKAKQAAVELIDHLSPGDIFSLITYSDGVEVLVPAQEVEDKERLKARIARIQSGGSTALYGGVNAGAKEVEKYLSSKKINRVILLSDGLANIGPSSPGALRDLGRELSERGVSVTTIGVGDDYNEDLMAGLAESSDANYYYVKDTEKLPEIFAKELGELFAVAARDIRIEIICPDGVRPMGFLGRSEKFQGQKVIVNLNQFTGGQNRYLLLRCQVNESKNTAEVARVNVSYTDELEGGKTRSTSGTATVKFTREEKVAASSVRAEIVSQKELLVTAVAKDQALKCADAGQYKEAAKKLESQAVVLEIQCATAPAALQSQLREEVQNLRQYKNQIEQGQYDKAARKSLQSQSYNTRNSK